MLKTTVSIQMPSELADKIRHTAESKGMGSSAFIRGVLLNYFNSIDAKGCSSDNTRDCSDSI